jgi:thioredoxin-related protein
MIDISKDSDNLSQLGMKQNYKLKEELNLSLCNVSVLIVDSKGIVVKTIDNVGGDALSIWDRVCQETYSLPTLENGDGGKKFSDAKKTKRSPVKKNNVEVVEKKVENVVEKKVDSVVEKIPGTGQSTPDGWMDDFLAAQHIAANEKKLLFVVFSGSDWCGWCKRYADELLVLPEFQKAIKDRYVLVYIDSPRDKSLLSAKCLEQNPMVKEMLGARGGVPETIIATSDGVKLLSLSGCRHIERGAESYLEFFNPIDSALRVIAEAHQRSVTAGEGSKKADAIRLEAYRKIDEDILIQHFGAELRNLISRRKEMIKYFPYFKYVWPVENEYLAFVEEMNRTARSVVFGKVRRYDREKILEAQKIFFAENGGHNKVATWLEKLNENRGMLSIKGDSHLQKLQMKIKGLRNRYR